jgi:hypothetical protein
MPWLHEMVTVTQGFKLGLKEMPGVKALEFKPGLF